MTDPREASFHCEAKLHGFRRTAEGVVVSFVLHPAEVPPALALDPLGTRYMLGLCQIGDDEQPVPPVGPSTPTEETTNPQPAGGASKERRPWHTLPPQQRAGMLCADKGFQKWVSDKAGWECDEQDSRDWLCTALGIKSRAEIATDPYAQEAFSVIEGRFMRESGRAVEVR